MQQPARGTALHDIENVEAYVRAAVSATDLRLTDDERDELIAEGLLILLKLADRYEHHRTGYSQPGSFAGYASTILPGRLRDAWRRLTGQRYVKGEDGQRHWEPGPATVSLEALDDRGSEPLVPGRDDEPEVETFEQRLKGALRDSFEERLALCSRVALMRADGMSRAAVAGELGVPLRDVEQAEQWLADAVGRLE